MATLPLLLSAYLSKPSNVIYVSKVYFYDKNLTLTQNMPGNLSFSENDFLLNSGLMTVYNNLINYINLINPSDIPVYSALSSLQYGDYFINPNSNNFQATQIIQNSTSSNVNNSKIINFVATVDSEDLNFGTVKPDYTNILTSINNNLSSLKDTFKNVFEFPSGESVLRGPENYSYNYNFLSQFLRFSRFFGIGSTGAGVTGIPDNEKLLFKIQSKLSETVSSVDVPLLKEIALAISSLASANDNQAIKALKDTISALELKVENNNVLLIDGQQDFCIKDYKELEPNSD